MNAEELLASLLTGETFAPPPSKGGRGGGSVGRPHGVIERRIEEREGVEYLVEVIAPESFPAERRGNGRVAGYAKPKPKTVAGRGSGSGVWTGSQGDQTILNCVRNDTRAATRWFAKHGDLLDAPYNVIGKRALIAGVRAARSHEENYCPEHEQAHVLDDFDAELAKILTEYGFES